MLSVRNIGKTLGDFALRDVSFDVAEGDYFVLLGASGVGKTVLLEMLTGLIESDEGRVILDTMDITHAKVQQRRLGLVYQDQVLFPHMTVRRNIGFGLHDRKMSRVVRKKRIEQLADDVGATALLDQYPESLSGGEAQRVALARTLATEPRCLLLDEPLSSLDNTARSAMRSLLRGLNRQGHTVLHVTHDYEEALSLASRVAVMENGAITQTGPPREIFQHPRSQFVAQFVGIRNFFKGRLDAPPNPGAPSRFVTDSLTFVISTDAPPGPGYLMVRSEDVAISEQRLDSSALNTFQGTICDIVPARLGVEVFVDIGVEIAALITEESVKKLKLECGRDVWISYKASAARFIEE